MTNAAETKDNVTAMPDKKTAKGDSVTIKLSRAIETHNGTVKELVLQEPRAEMLLRHGLPWKNVVISGSSSEESKFEVEFVPAKMALYLEDMTGVDRATLGDMSARDMNSAFNAILTLLQPAGN